MSQDLKPKKGYKKVKGLFGKTIDIPEDWEKVNVENVADITTGSKNTQDRIKNGKYPFYVRSQKIERINSFSYDEEAILTAGDGVGTGKVFHYINGKFDLHQRAYKISKFSEKLNGRYFYYYFKKNFFNRAMSMNANATVDSIRMDTIAKMFILLPPLTEQQKIATTLSNVDNFIDTTQKITDQIKSLKKGLIHKLLASGINHTKFKKAKWLFRKEIGIPDEWKVTPLAELILNTKNGFSGQPNDESRGLPRLGITSVTDSNSLYVNENLHRFIEIPKSKIDDYQVKKNDLLMCRQNGNKSSVGTIRVVKKTITPLIFSDSLILTQVNLEKLIPEFLVLFLDSPDGKKQISKYLGTTAGNYSLNGTDLRKIEILCPPLSEQQQIAIIISNIDSQIQFQTQYKEKLEKLKKSLMQNLLTGEVRVKV